MFTKRIKKLQAFLDSPILIKKKENLLYLTGRSFMNGYLLATPSHHPAASRHPSLPCRQAGSGRRGVVVFFGDGLEKSPAVKFDRLKNIGLYLGGSKNLLLEDEFTFAEYAYIKHKTWNIKHKGKRIKIEHTKSPVDFQRQIKEPGEIALIKKSMQIVGQVFNLVRKEIKKPGMTEIKLAQFIQTQGLRMGANDISFPAIVASGANAAVPHHIPSSKKLKPGESIIIDFGFSAGGGSASGGELPGYCSDFTRTVFLKKIPSRLERVYNQVEKVYWESIKFIDSYQEDSPLARGLSSIKAKDVYQRAVDVLAEAKLDKYFIHSLGHGTGLEIHELPNLSSGSKDVLQNGMVFSIEPGVYIPKLGGVRIEDLVVLKKKGVEKFINISTSLKDSIL